MSILIPANQLSQTIITIRCDSPSTAPQVECSLDEQHKGLPSSHVAPAPPAPSPLSTPLSIAGSLPAASADLNLQRGIDQRGHYIRLSFLPVSCLSHQSWSQLDCMPTDSSYFLGGRRDSFSSLSGQSSPAHHPADSSLHLHALPYAPTKSAMGLLDRNLVQPCTTTLTEAFHPSSVNNGVLSEQNGTFSFAQDLDLVSALSSFITDSDFTQNVDYLMCQPEHNTTVHAACPTNMTASASPQQRADLVGAPLPLPTTPELSSSSVASSSTTSSPTTPLNFFFSPSSIMDADTGAHSSGLGGPGGPMKDHLVADSATLALNDSRLSSTPSPKLPALPPPLPTTTKQQQQQQQQPSASGSGSGSGSLPKSSDSRLLPCPQQGCRRQFKSTSTLSGHMKTHAGKGARFPCSFPPCTEKFSRRHDQLRHEVYKHGKRCDWVCAKCNSFFSYERSLEKHTCTLDKSRRGSVPYLSAAAAAGTPCSTPDAPTAGTVR